MLLFILFRPAAANATAAPYTTFNINVSAPGNTVPYAADAFADMAGADTHFNASIPYNTASIVKTTLDNSNIRHVRDGNAGSLPSHIHQGVAFGVDKANPYFQSGNGAFSVDQANVNSLLSTYGPQSDYIELCGNEQDNDSNTVGNGTHWPTMLADCVVNEVAMINTYYAAHPDIARLPIAAPSVENINHGPELASALDCNAELVNSVCPSGHTLATSNKKLLDFANFHPGTGALPPGVLVSCTDTTDKDKYGDVDCVAPYSNKTLQQVATMFAANISKTGAFFATEWGFSDKKNTSLDSTGHVTGYIYNRVNGIPESEIAGLDPRSLLEWYNGGATRLYFYQFADVASDCTFGAQGLITATLTSGSLSGSGGEPYQNDDCSGNYNYTNGVVLKPEFNAVNNLIGLFADPGNSFSPTQVNASITVSNATNVHHLIAEKRDGTILVALWCEETDYDWVGQQACAIGSSVVTPVIDYPTTLANHRYGCKVTSELANVSIHGYSPSRLDVFGSDGNVTYTTSNIPSMIPLATAYPSVLELRPQ